VSGLLLLTNSYALLATTFVAPIIVNILLVHIFMAPAGLPVAAFVTAPWVVSAYPYRVLLSPLFHRRFDAVERAELLVSLWNSVARRA
jgi:putative oxidoreductase